MATQHFHLDLHRLAREHIEGRRVHAQLGKLEPLALHPLLHLVAARIILRVPQPVDEQRLSGTAEQSCPSSPVTRPHCTEPEAHDGPQTLENRATDAWRACVSVIASADLTHRLESDHWKSMSSSRAACQVSTRVHPAGCSHSRTWT